MIFLDSIGKNWHGKFQAQIGGHVAPPGRVDPTTGTAAALRERNPYYRLQRRAPETIAATPRDAPQRNRACT
jgi:hypothetical protein